MTEKLGWWTHSGNIGLPPLARVMGVGRQQQDMKAIMEKVNECVVEYGLKVNIRRSPWWWCINGKVEDVDG